jgi:hypothetical protein
MYIVQYWTGHRYTTGLSIIQDTTHLCQVSLLLYIEATLYYFEYVLLLYIRV